MKLTKNSLLKLTKYYDLPSLTEDGYEKIRELVYLKLYRILKISSLIRKQKNTKILTSEDIRNSIRLDGTNGIW